MPFILATVISAWRGIARRPALAWGGAGAVVLATATVTLSGPVNGRFTVLGETRAGQVTTMRWPAQWPLDASQSASRPPGDPSARVPI